MSLQHIQKNSPGLLPKPAKFEKNPPNGYRVIRKSKCGAGGARSSPIHKQASLAGRLNIPSQDFVMMNIFWEFEISTHNTLCSRWPIKRLAESKKKNAHGGHLVFQNETKNIPREDFIIMNIS